MYSQEPSSCTKCASKNIFHYNKESNNLSDWECHDCGDKLSEDLSPTMDPNENLRMLRSIISSITTAFSRNEDPDPEDVQEMVLFVESMDEWLSKGGFLPNEWKRTK